MIYANLDLKKVEREIIVFNVAGIYTFLDPSIILPDGLFSQP